jgi:putative intracellular protease/amidase
MAALTVRACEYDEANNAVCITIIESFYSNKKPIGAVCHGPCVLVYCKGDDQCVGGST